MAKAKNTSKLVLTSVILSILILAVFTGVFILFIVPAYNISRDDVYNILSKALPILIGLVFIEIAVITSGRNNPDNDEYMEKIDKLAPNAYDSPLYTRPLDDPSSSSVSGEEFDFVKKETVVREVIKEIPVEVIKEVVKEVPVEVVREVPVEVEVIKEVPVEVVKEVEKEVPVEVIREVPVEIVKEIAPEVIIKNNYTPVEIIKETVKEVPVEVIREVEREVPVEIIKETIKEVPVEVIREVPVEVIKEVIVEKEPEVIIKNNYTPLEIKVPEVVEKEVEVKESENITFMDALKEEIDAAKDLGYPLTLVSMKEGDTEEIGKAFDAPVFNENGIIYVILPFTRRKDVLKKARLHNANIVELDKSGTPESILERVSR